MMLEIVDEPLEVGAVIAGKYRLEALLGQGGMGVVWRATEIGTERPLALKFLRQGTEGDQKNRARFLREARAAMAVTHPNVARVNAVLETDTGLPFIVMDLLEGDSLRDVLRKRAALTIADCARFFVPIVDAVEAAHALGIVHRDLKPENVFLADGEHVRVLDFGIAKQMPKADQTASASLTSTGALLGTPQYMAPEQIFGDDDLDGRADVWALGVMLYECLVGRRPIEGAGLGPIIRRITVDPNPSLTSVPGVSAEVARLVDRMLSRDRNARPSLAEIRETILRAAQSGDVATRNEKVERRPGAGAGGTVPTAAPLRPRSQPVTPPAVGPTPIPMMPMPMMQPTTTAGIVSRRPSLDTQQTTPASPASRAPAFAIAIGAMTLLVGGAVATEKLHLRERLFAPKTSASIEGVPEAGPLATATANDGADAALVGDLEPAADASTALVPARRVDAATATAAGDEPRTAKVWRDLAIEAFLGRDGKTCIHAFDEADALEANAARLSTTPSGSYADKRGTCMMYAGECDNGKALYAKWDEAHGVTAGAALTHADNVAVSACTGAVGPREEYNRAARKLHSGATLGNATAKECLDARATMRRIAPSLKPRDADDKTVAIELSRLIVDAPECLMNVGDCASAFRVYREEYMLTRPPATDAAQREQDIKDEWGVIAANKHRCKGTP